LKQLTFVKQVHLKLASFTKAHQKRISSGVRKNLGQMKVEPQLNSTNSIFTTRTSQKNQYLQQGRAKIFNIYKKVLPKYSISAKVSQRGNIKLAALLLPRFQSS